VGIDPAPAPAEIAGVDDEVDVSLYALGSKIPEHPIAHVKRLAAAALRHLAAAHVQVGIGHLDKPEHRKNTSGLEIVGKLREK
jgi:hypothetical protein